MYRVYLSCWPSTFNPAVGPNVESLAGEPESPNALAVPINAINAIVSSPIDAPKGMNNDAIIGIVANDDQYLK